ncbi:MAG: alpha/beta hydrolase family esterase [Alphaproteobacteria bacterium]
MPSLTRPAFGSALGALAAFLAILALAMPSVAAELKPSANSAALPATLPEALVVRQLPHDGQIRYFLEHVPQNVKDRPVVMADRHAVVIDLHGGNGGMRRAFAHARSPHWGWLRLADEHGFLLLVPNGTNRLAGATNSDRQAWHDLRKSWDTRHHNPDDVGFLTALADWAVTERSADPKRIYVTGASNGGMMTFRLLIERPSVFAAGAAFIATLPVDGVPLPTAARPVMIMNGTADPAVPWGGGRLFKSVDVLRSSITTVDYWLEVHGLSGQPGTPTFLPDLAPEDGCRIVRRDYNIRGREPSTQPPLVRFYTMHGAGHWIPTRQQWPLPAQVREWRGAPCNDADGPALAWAFLRQHRLP